MSRHIAGMRGKAAVHAFNEKADGMLEPLLEVDENGSVSSNDSEMSLYSASTISVQVKPTPGQILKAVVGTSFGIACII